MKRTLLVLQAVFLVLTVSALFLAVCEITGSTGGFARFNYSKPVYDGKEEFDPSLQRLNSVQSLGQYCDSIYNTSVSKSGNFALDYSTVVRKTVRQRFYHGYSTFGFGNNFMALVGEVFYKPGISAVVLPEQILKYPYGACSQQSIVVMELLKRRGLQVRKVGFPQVNGMGHFCVEVNYNKAWHFIDVDMEPNMDVLASHNFPDAAYLAAHEDVVKQAYAGHEQERAVALFGTRIFYGDINAFPAKTGKLYQLACWVLSYTIWLFFAICFILARRKYRSLASNYVRNSRIHFPQPQPARSAGSYPDFALPRT